MVATLRLPQALGLCVFLPLLSVATVWLAYSSLGSWPPYYTAYIASVLLATAFWLLIALVSRQAIYLVRDRVALSTLFSTMTVIAAVCGGIRCFGFYPMLFSSLLILLFASFVRHDSNRLYALRRAALRKLVPVRSWLPGAFAGGSALVAMHLYDVHVGMLNKGRFEISISLIIMFLFCCLAGASLQVLAFRGVSALTRLRTKSTQS